MFDPWEHAAIDHSAAQGRAVTAHQLRQRVHDDVGAVLDRAQQDRGRHGVVDDQRNAVAMGDVGERGQVGDVAGGIADALAEHCAGVGIDHRLDVGGAVARGKPGAHAEAGHGVRQQRVCGAIEVRRAYDVAPGLQHVQDRMG